VTGASSDIGRGRSNPHRGLADILVGHQNGGFGDDRGRNAAPVNPLFSSMALRRRIGLPSLGALEPLP
jgi:hypothetical protein